MAWNEKINDKDFESRLVKNLADRPNAPSTYGVGGMSAKQLKEWFDNSANSLKDKINAIIEALGGVEALSNIRITDESGKEVSAKEWIENKLLVTSLENPGSVIDIQSWVESANKLMSENAAKVGFTDYATSSKAGVVKVAQGGDTDIGISATGVIRVLKANEDNIAIRGANYADYVLTSSKTNSIVKAALIDKNKLDLADNEKATARKTLGAASAEDVNGMHLALSMDEATFKLKVSLLSTNNEVISTSNEIDLPIEEMVIGIDVNENGDGYILKLKTGETVPLSTEAIVRGFAKQETLDAVIEDVEALKKKKIELAPTLDGNDTDKAPSVKAVNEGLSGKVDVAGASPNNRLYGVTDKGEPTMFVVNGGNSNGVVPKFTAPNYIGDKDGGATFAVTTPTKKYHPANKKYVDDSIASIASELGKQVFKVTRYIDAFYGCSVPDGALPYFYLENAWFEYSYSVDGVYGENFAKGDFTELIFYGENDTVLDTKSATPRTFYEMPSGTVRIECNARDCAANFDPSWDTYVLNMDYPLTFQVKVGA